MSRPTQRFRSIAFDAVGTLIHAEPSVTAAYAQIGQQFGSRLTADELRPRLGQLMQRPRPSDSPYDGREEGVTNECAEREFWQSVVRQALPDVSDSDRCFQELFEHFARPTSWRCFEDVAPTLMELRRRGYQILIASNFDARLHSVCDGLPELRDIPGRVISSLVGYRKPHPFFFVRLVESAGCSPREILLVGDDFENDVQAARNALLSAVHLRRDVSAENLQRPHEVSRLTELLELLP